MTLTSLVLTLAFVGVVMLISVWRQMGLERDLLLGTIRAAVQLTAIGYILLWVFKWESWPATVAILTVMLLVAARTAAKRAQQLPGIFWRTLGTLALTELITVGLMLALQIIPNKVQFIVPISGMVIGNAMVNAGLLLNRLQGEVSGRRAEIEAWLSLGASPRKAGAGALKAAVKAAMIPSIDALKTVGLVQLPGMMTGQILAGANPVDAVKYQILIMYSLAAASAMCSISLSRLSLPLFFTQHAQLVPSTQLDQ